MVPRSGEVDVALDHQRGEPTDRPGLVSLAWLPHGGLARRQVNRHVVVAGDAGITGEEHEELPTCRRMAPDSPTGSQAHHDERRVGGDAEGTKVEAGAPVRLDASARHLVKAKDPHGTPTWWVTAATSGVRGCWGVVGVGRGDVRGRAGAGLCLGRPVLQLAHHRGVLVDADDQEIAAVGPCHRMLDR